MAANLLHHIPTSVQILEIFHMILEPLVPIASQSLVPRFAHLQILELLVPIGAPSLVPHFAHNKICIISDAAPWC